MLRIKLNFSDPTAVSPFAKYDRLVIYIKDLSDLFDDYQSRRRLNPTIYSMKLVQPIQK